jgi:hypothetical protein
LLLALPLRVGVGHVEPEVEHDLFGGVVDAVGVGEAGAHVALVEQELHALRLRAAGLGAGHALIAGRFICHERSFRCCYPGRDHRVPSKWVAYCGEIGSLVYRFRGRDNAETRRTIPHWIACRTTPRFRRG